MASTTTTIAETNDTITYALLVVFTVTRNSHVNLQDQQAIRDEAQSWIESLDAFVDGVSVRRADVN